MEEKDQLGGYLQTSRHHNSQNQVTSQKEHKERDIKYPEEDLKSYLSFQVLDTQSGYLSEIL